MIALADEMVNASKSLTLFESWIDKKLADVDVNSTLHQRIVALNVEDVYKVFADSINKNSPFQKLLKLLKELDDVKNEDSRVRILCENQGGFIRGMSLLFVDPVAELACNRVRKSNYVVNKFCYFG